MVRQRQVLNQIKPSIPFAYLYETAEKGPFVTNTPHPFNIVKIITSDFQYSASQDRITYIGNTSGFFKITFLTTAQSRYNQACWSYLSQFPVFYSHDLKLYLNGALIPASIASGYGYKGMIDLAIGTPPDYYVTRYYLDYWGSAMTTTVVYLTSGDYIQAIVHSDAGVDVYTRGGTSRLIIEALSNFGWDNGSGGNRISSLPL